MAAKTALFLSVFAGLHLFASLIARPALAQVSLAPPAVQPLRDLPKDQPYELRVLYLEERRLPSLSPEQRQELYAKIERLLDGWYGYRVRLKEVNHQSLTSYFSVHKKLFARQAARIRGIDIDVTNATGHEKLRAAIARDFRPRALTQIEHHLHAGPLTSKPQAVDVAQQQFLRRLSELREIPAGDGRPFFDATQSRLSSYAHCAVLLEAITEADLVLTNSMILGADAEMPIYVIARGGLTTAVTDNNARSPYQGAMMVGAFPFLSDAPVFLRERGRIPDGELLDVIATFCMHELGHFFLRFDEHYDHPHCVHVAPSGLDYYEWHKAIRAGGPCTLVHGKIQRF